jgi:hypothetical protein
MLLFPLVYLQMKPKEKRDYPGWNLPKSRVTVPERRIQDQRVHPSLTNTLN